MNIPPDTKLIITTRDYEILHEIKHLWSDFHKSYFSVGRRIDRITKLFEELGKNEIRPADNNKPKV